MEHIGGLLILDFNLKRNYMIFKKIFLAIFLFFLTDLNSQNELDFNKLNNYLNWRIPEENAKTINGLVTEYLDQIPQANLCIEIEDYQFELLELDENSISKIRIKKKHL